MKKLSILLLFSVLSITAFCQAKSTKPMTAADSVKIGRMAASAESYLIVMDRPSMINLADFIKNADMWSEKGRMAFLDELLKKVQVIPGDTTKKK